jgi:hypothetical protein
LVVIKMKAKEESQAAAKATRKRCRAAEGQGDEDDAVLVREELRRLRSVAGAMGPASGEARQLSGYTGILRRRITDRGRGGYYQFYGYKEFANRLFVVTRAGLERGFDIQALYGRAEGAFGGQLAEAVRRGDVLVNEELLAELRPTLAGSEERRVCVVELLTTLQTGSALGTAREQRAVARAFVDHAGPEVVYEMESSMNGNWIADAKNGTMQKLSDITRLPGPIGKAMTNYRLLAYKNKLDAAELRCMHHLRAQSTTRAQ